MLGAGVAGLATAYELGKAAYDCTILEALDRVGGRNWTIRGGDRLTELDGSTQTARFFDGPISTPVPPGSRSGWSPWTTPASWACPWRSSPTPTRRPTSTTPPRG
ncbi:FAD-dependent oxidoreductase [Nonomuraea jiangxiensis]|uniref:FAD-dependent oxidoreductase n=1 Tax=Nonomuraea jiangxiensis TaxID=633440 RepID=UPI001FE248A1|nr:FAD-dependent oxidoreductase [Nonomuraea jiangxiensis]